MLTKPDCGLIKILQEHGRQVCQVRVDAFGDETAISVIRSAETMTKLAKLYASGAVARVDLYTKRGELANEIGTNPFRKRGATSKSVALMRPAASNKSRKADDAVGAPDPKANEDADVDEELEERGP